MTAMCERMSPPGAVPPRDASLEVVSTCARLLFANGQTTKILSDSVQELAGSLGLRASVFPSWGELTLRVEGDAGPSYEMIATEPAGMDMTRVSATMGVVGEVRNGRMDAVAARLALEEIGRFPPVSLARFALLAGAGAAALAVIFGEIHLHILALIAISAGAGACLRRCVAGISHNLFIQPFCAALLAGIVGAIAVRLQLSSTLRLVAVCPCMVLVPGPHVLNGVIDLARGRLPLGIARLSYASLTTLMICAGLVIGLGLGGVSLPASGPFHAVPFGYDVLAAGVVVAAYGTFFNMPWRMLPIPVLVGMLAHASRWLVITFAAASGVTGAFVACLVVGIIMTPVADRMRLPFAGVAFASVVSLMPGVFLFRMASGMVDLVTLGAQAPQDLSVQVAADGATALLIIVAMAFGLIFPKMCLEYFMTPSPESPPGPAWK